MPKPKKSAPRKRTAKAVQPPAPATPPAAAPAMRMEPVSSTVSCVAHAPTCSWRFAATICTTTLAPIDVSRAVVQFKLVNDKTNEVAINDAPCTVDGSVVSCTLENFALAGIFLGRFKITNADGNGQVIVLAPSVYPIGV